VKHSIGDDRVFERTTGCWNCKHWAPDAGRAFWAERATQLLTRAKITALESRKGEQDVKVQNIMSMVKKIDGAMKESPPLFGLCLNAKAKEEDKLGDLIASAYLCTSGWSGAVGASIARAGSALDKTAAELIEDLDGTEAVEEQGLNK